MQVFSQESPNSVSVDFRGPLDITRSSRVTKASSGNKNIIIPNIRPIPEGPVIWTTVVFSRNTLFKALNNSTIVKGGMFCKKSLGTGRPKCSYMSWILVI